MVCQICMPTKHDIEIGHQIMDSQREKLVLLQNISEHNNK